MNAVINVTPIVVGNKTIDTVNARALHEFLGVSKKFTDWFLRKSKKHNMVLGVDFYEFLGSTVIEFDKAMEIGFCTKNNARGTLLRKFVIIYERTQAGIITVKDGLEQVNKLFEDGFNKFERKTALYRHFNSVGNLLYVGISLDADKRLRQHIGKSKHGNEIASVSVEYFTRWGEALKAERYAIKTEHPTGNVVHKSK